MKDELILDFYKYTEDILDTKQVKEMGRYIQHGRVTCLAHSIGVSMFSLIFVRSVGITCDEKALVRGALLHDYFLYDWHKKEERHRLHGFTHARTALKNATKDFELGEIEKDIIKSHMWPLNLLAMPRCKEAWIVTMVDKYCSSLETVSRIPFLKFLEDYIVNAGQGVEV